LNENDLVVVDAVSEIWIASVSVTWNDFWISWIDSFVLAPPLFYLLQQVFPYQEQELQWSWSPLMEGLMEGDRDCELRLA
jgi:hypothetical protein